MDNYTLSSARYTRANTDFAEVLARFRGLPLFIEVEQKVAKTPYVHPRFHRTPEELQEQGAKDVALVCGTVAKNSSFQVLCFDLDGCVVDDGQINPVGQALIRSMPGTYWEYSSSLRGAHVFFVSRGGPTLKKFEVVIGGQRIELKAHHCYVHMTGLRGGGDDFLEFDPSAVLEKVRAEFPDVGQQEQEQPQIVEGKVEPSDTTADEDTTTEAVATAEEEQKEPASGIVAPRKTTEQLIAKARTNRLFTCQFWGIYTRGKYVRADGTTDMSRIDLARMNVLRSEGCTDGQIVEVYRACVTDQRSRELTESEIRQTWAKSGQNFVGRWRAPQSQTVIHKTAAAKPTAQQTMRHLTDNALLQHWFDTHCILTTDGWTSSAELYASFGRATNSKVREKTKSGLPSHVQLGRFLKSRGLKRRKRGPKGQQEWGWLGVMLLLLRDDEHDDEEEIRHPEQHHHIKIQGEEGPCTDNNNDNNNDNVEEEETSRRQATSHSLRQPSSENDTNVSRPDDKSSERKPADSNTPLPTSSEQKDSGSKINGSSVATPLTSGYQSSDLASRRWGVSSTAMSAEQNTQQTSAQPKSANGGSISRT